MILAKTATFDEIEILVCSSVYLGDEVSNNLAEFSSLHLGLLRLVQILLYCDAGANGYT